jgi:hypothetical protein
MTVSIDRIADMAQEASFYEDPQGEMSRILYCDLDLGFMQLENDYLGEFHVYFSTVKFTGSEGFYRAVKMNPLDN